MFRLATSNRLQQFFTQLPSRMLRLWETRSRSSGLPSRRESLEQILRINLTHGGSSWQKRGSPIATQNSLINLNTASQQVSNPSQPPLPHQTNPPLKLMQQNSSTAYERNSRKDSTLDHSQEPRLKPPSAPFNHHRLVLFRNRESQENSGLSKTYPFPTFLAITSPQSTAQSTQTFFHAPGAPSQSSHSLSGNSPLFLKLQYETSRKPTEPILWHHPNGQDWSSNWRKATLSQSTHATALGSHRDVVAMESLVMPACNSCECVVWAQSQNGWMIISSSESAPAISKSTMRIVESEHPTSLQMEVNCKTEAACGSKARQCPMTIHRSLMRTTPLPSEFAQAKHLDERVMPSIPIAWPTSMKFPMNWASHGNGKKTFPLALKHRSRDSYGILKRAQCKSLLTRRRNTWRQFSVGKNPPSTHSKKSKNFTENFYMYAKWFQPVELISPTWKNSWPSSVFVLSCHVPNPTQWRKISSGGSENCHKQQSADSFPALTPSLTSQLSRTLARKWVSGLSSVEDGGLGDSSRDGKQKEETSAGQRQSASYSSSQPSWRNTVLKRTIKSTETTKEWLKDGGRAEAETRPQMKFSNSSTPFAKTPNLPSSHAMLLASTTQQMGHREESMVQGISFSHPSPSQPNSNNWLSTLTQKLRKANAEKGDIYGHSPNQPQSQISERELSLIPDLKDKLRNSSLKQKIGDRNSPRLILHPLKFRPPPQQPSGPSHLPLISPLRPHVLARDRLRLWRPSSARNILDAEGMPTNLNQSDLAQIMDTLSGAWETSTRETYGSGLLVFHIFCDNKNIPEEQRAPLSPVLAAAFISTIAGTYSCSAIRNYFYGVRAWHLLHGVRWQMNEPEMEALLRAAEKAAPPASKKKK